MKTGNPIVTGLFQSVGRRAGHRKTRPDPATRVTHQPAARFPAGITLLPLLLLALHHAVAGGEVQNPPADTVLYPVCDTFVSEAAPDAVNGGATTLRLNTTPILVSGSLARHDASFGFIRFDTSAWPDATIATAESIILHVRTAQVETPGNWRNIQYLEWLTLSGAYATDWDASLTWNAAGRRGLTRSVIGDRLPNGVIDPLHDECAYEIDVSNYVRQRRLRDKTTSVAFKVQKARQADSHDLFDKVSAPFLIYSSRSEPARRPYLELHRGVQKAVSGSSAAVMFKDPGFLSDPQKVSDEAFFGRWDAAANAWNVRPILRYGEYPALAETEGRVRAGNYPAAKECLLKYYRACPRLADVRAEKPRDLDVRLIAEEIYGAGAGPVGEFALEGERTWHAVRLNGSLADAANLILFDPDKADGDLVFAAHEAGPDVAPRLEVVFQDNTTQTLVASKDATIRAGRYEEEVLGTRKELRVREAGMPMSDDTQRTYLFFDVAKIDRRQPVKDITLRLWGTTEALGGRSRCYVLSGKPAPAEFDETRLTWKSVNPRIFNYKDSVTGRYGGFNWVYPPDADGIWFSEFTRMVVPAQLAAKYAATRDEAYARKALTTLLGFYHLRQDRVHAYIDQAFRVPYVMSTTFRLLDSKTMTPELFTALLKFIHQHAQENDPAGAGRFSNNRASGQIAGALSMAFYFGEVMPVTVRNQGDYWGQAVAEALAFCRNVIGTDGAYGEAVTGVYVRGVLANIEQLHDRFRLLGKPVPPALTGTLNALARYLLNTAYPNGQGVVYGDANPMDIRPVVAEVAQRTGNPLLLWVSTNGKEGKMTQPPSKFYPAAGLVMLKTSWLDSNGLALFSNANNNRGHAHADDLNVDFYALGRPLLREPGSVSYSPRDPQDGRRTCRHNTLAVDGKDQVLAAIQHPSQAAVTRFVDNGLLGYVDEFTDANTQAGAPVTDRFRHTRRILLLKESGYAIVADRVDTCGDASKPHTYTVTWNPDLNALATLDPQRLIFATHYDAGANVQVIPAAPEELKAELRTDNYIDNVRNDRNGFVVYSRPDVKGSQSFETILYPACAGEHPEIPVQRLGRGEERAGAGRLAIGLPGGRQAFFLTRHSESGPIRWGPFETDAAVAYAELAPSRQSYFLVDGSYLRKVDSGETVVQADKPLAALTICLTGKTARVWTANPEPARVRIPLTGVPESLIFNDERLTNRVSPSGWLEIGPDRPAENRPPADF